MTKNKAWWWPVFIGNTEYRAAQIRQRISLVKYLFCSCATVIHLASQHRQKTSCISSLGLSLMWFILLYTDIPQSTNDHEISTFYVVFFRAGDGEQGGV
jgi:hypothetical protein